jgi:N-acetylmuramoyl-L-alanine amidase
VNILGPPTATVATAAYNLGVVNKRFLAEMFSELWDAAARHGIDPVVMVAQSLKETGGGNYLGKVPATFYNTCGLKIRDPALGAQAHAQHLIAYTQTDLGSWGEPLVDPRWVWVRKPDATPVLTVEALGGRWAPSPTYGTELAAICTRLRGT